jgi:hypothetical protein
LLREAPVPLAMVGLLTAFPGTPLWRRLDQAGRLRSSTTGDAFGRPNFEPTMPEEALVRSYAALLKELYSPEGYFRRAAALVDRIGAPTRPSQVRGIDLVIAAQVVMWLGIFGKRRVYFWKLLVRGLRRGFAATRSAISCAIMGEHLIRYTDEVMTPRLERTLAQLAAEQGASEPLRARKPSQLASSGLQATVNH